VRKLNALDRYLFLYMLTNEHVSWCGIYELDLAMMAFECGIDKEDLEKTMLPRLSPKVIYEDGWVFIPNFPKYHSGGPNAEKGYKAAIEALPDRIRAKIKGIFGNKGSKNNPLEGGPPSTSTSTSAFTSTFNNAPLSASRSLKSKKDKYADKTPMNCDEFIAWCRESPQRHIQVLAEWVEGERPDLTTKGQWRRFIDRNLRQAMNLIAYSNEQLQTAYGKMLGDVLRVNPKTGKKEGYLSKYTLETLEGYIT
jgi:hypothetical protein